MENKIRTLVVDDSAFARKVVREILSASADIEVVGTAQDGLEALEKIAALKPEVITLDLVMPNLDGIGVLRALPKTGGPRVVIVSMSDAESELGAEALAAGAVGLVHKPSALATARLYDMAGALVSEVRNASTARVRYRDAVRPPDDSTRSWPHLIGRFGIVVIGTSTGGPLALNHLLPALPREIPIPIAIALHIPEGYTDALCRRLDAASEIKVVEARDNLQMQPGVAVLARGGSHLELRSRGDGMYCGFPATIPDSNYCPSVNHLFASAAKAYGSRVLGVVMTGMGDDGLEGARAIRAAGGAVLTESPSSAVIYGMPRCVKEANLSSGEAALDGMADEIVRRLRGDID